jgi:hypothetical protein
MTDQAAEHKRIQDEGRRFIEKNEHVSVVDGYYKNVKPIDRKKKSKNLDQNAPGFLYRHFDIAKVLLYVGVERDPLARLGAHIAHSRWREMLVWVHITRFATRREALIAETTAIRVEKPLYNVAGSIRGQNRLELRKIERLLAFDLAELDGNEIPTAEDWTLALISAPKHVGRPLMFKRLLNPVREISERAARMRERT